MNSDFYPSCPGEKCQKVLGISSSGILLEIFPEVSSGKPSGISPEIPIEMLPQIFPGIHPEFFFNNLSRYAYEHLSIIC